MLGEILTSKLKEELVCNLNRLININMLFDVLKVLENYCEIIIDYYLFARHNNGDCEETYELKSIVWWKYALPNP